MIKRFWPVGLALLLILGFFLASPGPGSERTDNGYYSVVTEEGRELLITGMRVSIGDQFIDNDDTRYEIKRIEGDTAYAVGAGLVSSIWKEAVPTAGASQPVQAPIVRKIGIYHTHSGESYTPSEGKALVIGRGGIYQVGSTMKSVLAEYGIEAIHSDTIHQPVGRASPYIDSRRTAMKLIQSGVDAVFDLHRDTAPVREYARMVEGIEVARVLIVLGRSNPIIRANEELAFRLRDKLNELYPGLLRGIYYARGGYNQDLSPQAMLIEIGTAGNTREEAEAGVALFTTAIPPVLYGMTHNPAELQPQEAAGILPPSGAPPGGGGGPGIGGSTGSVRALAWILTLTILGMAFFLALNEGSLKGIKTRLALFKNIEFTNFLGRKPADGQKLGPPGPEENKEDETEQ